LYQTKIKQHKQNH